MERCTMQQYIAATQSILDMDDDDDLLSNASTDASSLSFSFSSLSFSSSSSFSLSSSSDANGISDDDTSLGNAAVTSTVAYYNHVYTPLVSATIEFGCHPLIGDYSDADCIAYFQFHKTDLQTIVALLWACLSTKFDGNYESVVVNNGYRVPFETGLLICLYHLAYPCRIRPEMECFFGMRKSHISAVLSCFFDVLYDLANNYLSNPVIFQNNFLYYSNLIQAKSQVNLHVWGFIDGTVRRTCCPIHYSVESFSGHKKCYGIKFQAIMAPDGIIASIFGPVPAGRHDAFLLAESNLLHDLQAMMPTNGDNPVYCLYGDSAYPLSQHLLVGFRFAEPGSPEAAFNTAMAKVSQCVEWGFHQVSSQWKTLDFVSNQKFYSMPIGQYYIVGTFFQTLGQLFMEAKFVNISNQNLPLWKNISIWQIFRTTTTTTSKI